MIGFYNYSVLVTYLGVALSVFGMSLACNGHFEYAILCLALAGACDTFDGKIARSMKNRTKEMEIFGIQIDSLCDLVCFGVSPVILAYHLGLNTVWGIAVEIIFVLCGVIRLAFFNVQEELKHLNPELEGNGVKYFRGLPITSITIIFPVVFLLRPVVAHNIYMVILAIMLLVVAFLYILDFKLKKPGNVVIGLLMLYVAVVMLRIFQII